MTTPERGHGRVADDVVEFHLDGVRWLVTEHSGDGVPGARGDRCLIFMSADMARRVWNYPPDWRTLPPAKLIALSWGA
jgi:hypothetical protein